MAVCVCVCVLRVSTYVVDLNLALKHCVDDSSQSFMYLVVTVEWKP